MTETDHNTLIWYAKKRYLFSKLITLVIIPWYVIKNVTKLENLDILSKNNKIIFKKHTLQAFKNRYTELGKRSIFFPASYLLEDFVLL